jgi:hypothetical protein
MNHTMTTKDPTTDDSLDELEPNPNITFNFQCSPTEATIISLIAKTFETTTTEIASTLFHTAFTMLTFAGTLNAPDQVSHPQHPQDLNHE